MTRRAFRNIYRRACITALACVITACTLQPRYTRPGPAVAATYPTGAAYEANARAQGTTAAGDVGWRDFLADPRLQQLVEIALKNNQDLRTAMLTVEQLQAQFRVQRAAMFPQISVLADRERSRTPPDLFLSQSRASSQSQPQGGGSNFGSYTVGVAAEWEIDFFGRLRSLKAAAVQQYLASVQGRKAAEILLISQVADQYLTMLADDELLEVTQQTLDTAQVSYQITKLLFDTGAGTELDLRQAETVVEQARANQSEQLRLRAQAENGLVLLLGQPAPPPTAPAVRLGDQPILTDIPAGLPSELLTRRPDVLQAEAQLLAANANIGAARAAFFPRITLTGDAGTASAKLSGLFKAGSAAWDWEPTLTLPIFTGGANRANLDVANLQKQISIAQYQKAIQTAFREVADGLASRGTYDNQIASLDRFTNAQRRRLELADLLFKNGQADYLDVLTAQTDLYNAQLVLVAARLQRQTNLVDLYRALGGGWLEHTGEAPRSGDPAEELHP